MTLYPPQLLHDLEGATLFLDTNVFSIGIRSRGLIELLAALRNQANCAFTTIPSVLFEFVRGSNSVEVYNENIEFFNSLVSYVNPASFLNNISDFSIVMAKVNAKNKSYTDFLLAACLYNYRRSGKVYLLTTDINAFPSFFERTDIVTVTEDKSAEIRNFGIFKFNTDSYVQAVEQVLRESK